MMNRMILKLFLGLDQIIYLPSIRKQLGNDEIKKKMISHINVQSDVNNDYTNFYLLNIIDNNKNFINIPFNHLKPKFEAYLNGVVEAAAEM